MSKPWNVAKCITICCFLERGSCFQVWTSTQTKEAWPLSKVFSSSWPHGGWPNGVLGSVYWDDCAQVSQRILASICKTSISIWKNLIFNTHRPRTNGFGIGFLRRNRIKQLGPFWMGWSPGKAKRCLHQSQHPRLPWRLLRAETWSVAPQLPIPGAPWGSPTIEYPIETMGYWTESIQLGSLLRKWWYYNYGVKDGKRQISMIHKAGNPEKTHVNVYAEYLDIRIHPF